MGASLLPVLIDQSSSELCLRLYRGHPHKEAFTILSSARLEGAELALETHIIGASHAAFLTAKGLRFAEVFACAGPEDGPSHRLAERIDGPKGVARYRAGEYAYRFESHCVSSLEGMDRLEELENTAPRNGVSVQSVAFPRQGDDGAPKTVIVASLNDYSVQIETAHSYPNEAMIVFTKSALKRGTA